MSMKCVFIERYFRKNAFQFLSYNKHNTNQNKKQTYIQNICSKFLLKKVDTRKHVRYNTAIRNICSQHTFYFERRPCVMYADRMACMRIEDEKSERRILRNRIRRQQEMKKNFFLLLITVCLITACSVSLSGFRSNAKDDSTEASYKYYKSIVISGHDTLWSIAQEYMDADHYDSIDDYIKEVKHMNSLTDDAIQYGEHLVIPYYDQVFIR